MRNLPEIIMGGTLTSLLILFLVGAVLGIYQDVTNPKFRAAAPGMEQEVAACTWFDLKWVGAGKNDSDDLIDGRRLILYCK